MGTDSRAGLAKSVPVFRVEVCSDAGRSEPACQLLAERGLQLFRDSATGPCTGIRFPIGYVSRDSGLSTLAHLMSAGADRELFPTGAVIHADVIEGSRCRHDRPPRSGYSLRLASDAGRSGGVRARPRRHNDPARGASGHCDAFVDARSTAEMIF